MKVIIRPLKEQLKTSLSLILFILLFQLIAINVFSQWTQKGSTINGTDQFGFSFSLSSDGNTCAAGANLFSTDKGVVRVYDWDGSSWNQRGSDIIGEANNDNSGHSIKLSTSGNTIAIGAISNDGAGNSAGHVRVYNWNGSSWVQLGNDIDGEAANDQSGWAVDLASDGNTLAIGARRNDGTASNAGHVRIYTWNGSSWNQKGADIDGEASGDESGAALSLSASGDTIAIGAYANDGNGSNSGHVRIYRWTGSTWTKMGADIDGEAATDHFGWSVSLSSDGSILAAGARLNDGNGNSSGHVRIYDWDGSAWNQLGSDIDGEAAEDRFGNSVDLSSNGSIVAIGGRRNNGDAGHIRVYLWEGSSWSQISSDIDGSSTNNLGYSVGISSDGYTVGSGAPFSGGRDRIFSHNPLPIELLNFSANWKNKNQKEAVVSWSTETEINNEFFYVERSNDAIYFEDIARIDGAYNSNSKKEYTYIDESIPEESVTLFYRLRQTDFDGTSTHSSIETLNKTIGIKLISLYPNPNIGHFKYIVSSSVESNVKITITDLLGEIVKEKIEEINAGVNHLSLNVKELSNANYFIHIETEDGLYHTSSRFIIN